MGGKFTRSQQGESSDESPCRTPAYGTVQGRKAHDWEVAGEAWPLMWSACISVGKQLGVLAVMMYQIQANDSHFMLGCTSEMEARNILCVWTKTFVRCFPPFAITVSMLLAGRAILFKHVWTRYLRMGVIVDFDNIAAYRDPVLFLTLFAFFNGCAHFILVAVDHLHLLWREGSLAEKQDAYEDMQKAVEGFVIPSLLFLVFFYNEYDVEAHLLPINKYVESDPEEARLVLGHAECIEEYRLHTASHQVWVSPERRVNTVDEGLQLCLARAWKVDREQQDSSPFWQWRLWESFWPSRILCHDQLNVQSPCVAHFRSVWRWYSLATVLVTLAALGYFIVLSTTAFTTVRYGTTWANLAGLLVAVSHAIGVIVLTTKTLKSSHVEKLVDLRAWREELRCW
mmetsp:Transcript_28422/g.68305  ORF Transcript_28422/g.68305 Transcript_28422/m.68305 type:complete len:398 (+) Transcript_28422:153-1346(+)